MPAQTLTLVIATGQDSGLAPLTMDRTKSAVPFAGKFRIIDFTLANCLHSGLRKILVLI
jgi:glucose-1-phosphate adenylyltransferase